MDAFRPLRALDACHSSASCTSEAQAARGVRSAFDRSRSLLHELQGPSQGAVTREPMLTDPDIAQSLAGRLQSSSLDPGYVIDERYRIERVLGEGTFAWVYLARHTTIQNLQCAIKVLKPAFVEDDELREQFRHEAETIAHLTDKHTVRVSDFGELPDGRPYICMEYCIGATLDRVIERLGPLDDALVAHVGIGVLSSLIEAHKHSIVHRDIKPANVSLTEDPGSAEPLTRVLDFGIAFVAQSTCLPTTSMESDLVFCTPSYAAPEVLRGTVTPGADLYALGLTMAELLDGTPVFPNTGFYTVAARQMSAEPVPFGPRASASPLVRVLAKACQKDSSERYQSAEEMLADLNALRETLPASPQLAWAVVQPDNCVGVRRCSLASDQLDLALPAGCTDGTCESPSCGSHLRVHRETGEHLVSTRTANTISQTRLVADDVVDALLAMEQGRVEHISDEHTAIKAPVRMIENGNGLVALIVDEAELDLTRAASSAPTAPFKPQASDAPQAPSTDELARQPQAGFGKEPSVDPDAPTAVARAPLFSSEESARSKIEKLAQVTEDQRRLLKATDVAIGLGAIVLVVLLVAFGLRA